MPISSFKKLSNRGFSLLEVAVFSAIGGILLLTFTGFMASFQKGIASTRVRAFRDDVFQNLVHQSSSAAALQKTAATVGGKSAFSRCLGVSGAADCTNGVASEFDLYDPSGTRIAGTKVNPVRYSVDGAICTTTGNRCPFKAYSRFTPQCTGGAPSCDQAIAISISVTLLEASGISTAGSALPHMAPRTLASSVDVSLINAGGSQVCGANQMMTGIDTYGKIICTPLPSPPPPSDHFGGAWACELNTATLGCGACLTPNPMTGACTCPSGYSTLKVAGCDGTLYRCGFVCGK